LREAYEPALDEPRAKWGNTTRDAQDVQQALENILAANEYPPPSLPEVAKLLGHDSRVLSKWHRTLCQAISARYKEYVRQRTAARMQRYREELREAALELHAKGISPIWHSP